MKRAFACLLFLPACASAPDVLPAGGRQVVSAQAAGATVTVFASPWEGSPYDLGNYVTPIPIEFVNEGPAPLRVSYFDLALTDETGRRYAAINPYVAQEQSSSLPIDRSALVAGRGFRGGGGVRVGAPGVRMVAPRRPIVGHPFGGARVGFGFRGYAPYAHYRRWYGPGIAYWDYPFLFPAGYASWVWAWGPAYYPAPIPDDVLSMGLPEGVLQPGGRVSGFVYFQRATDAAHRLTLTWYVHDAQSGAPLGEAALPLDVIR